MKEYIKMGIGFTLGMFVTMTAIGALNKVFENKIGDETEENSDQETVHGMN